mmetsp:Transcript_18287/g.39447  ORF Transcript_18287/g.39447 Transcript_18287/m.39447 type:complete len:200 (+) Transcript_18287:802-1401(+)
MTSRSLLRQIACRGPCARTGRPTWRSPPRRGRGGRASLRPWLRSAATPAAAAPRRKHAVPSRAASRPCRRSRRAARGPPRPINPSALPTHRAPPAHGCQSHARSRPARTPPTPQVSVPLRSHPVRRRRKRARATSGASVHGTTPWPRAQPPALHDLRSGCSACLCPHPSPGLSLHRARWMTFLCRCCQSAALTDPYQWV